MASISNNRSSCFINDEDEIEAYIPYITKFNRSSLMRRSISSSGYASSPTKHYDFRFDHHRQPHFLKCCFLCRKSIAADSDIFMYRDIPFCSEECRMEQIEMDVAIEMRKRNILMKSGLQIVSKSVKNEEDLCAVVAA